MKLRVKTIDVEQLSDIEVGEFGDLVFQSSEWSVGFLSKEAEAWSLVSRISVDDRLIGFAFASLERIGGTPVVLFGLVSTAGSPEPVTILNALADEYLRRARISFPDEDVLVAARCGQRSHLQIFAGLRDVCPVGRGRIGGEERAWGSRLAKRFDAMAFDRRSMVMRNHDDMPRFDSAAFGPDSLRSIADFSSQPFLHMEDGEELVVWGWAPAEYLSSLTPSVAV